MKTTAAIRMLGLALFGTLAAASAASAVTVNHSGTMCKNFNKGDVSYIDYLSDGVRSYKTSATQVICPIVRPINTANGAYVWVDIKHFGTTSLTTSCTLSSYSSTGVLLGSNSRSWTGTGTTYSLRIPASGTVPTASFSDLALLCSIPGNTNGRIMGYDLVEN